MYPYIGFKCFVTNSTHERPVYRVDFEMFPDVGYPLEQFATLATLKVPGFIMNTEMFGQGILGDEALVAVQAFMGSITYNNKIYICN